MAQQPAAPLQPESAHGSHSQAAIARLRAYIPPPTRFYDLPLTRRAAVLILLYADRAGDLRVVLTMRASTLKSCGWLPHARCGERGRLT